jgi:hypothetical protein
MSGPPPPAGEQRPDPQAVLTFWKEQREQLRQSENQRATLTNYTLAISAALAGFMAHQDFAPGTRPPAAFVVALGLYGALAAAKYHERANYHLHQARALTRALLAMNAIPDLDTELQAARADHQERFGRLLRLRLHWLWTGLHLGIAVFGAALSALTLTSS